MIDKLKKHAWFAAAVLAMLVGMLLAWSQLALQWGDNLPDFAVAKVGQQLIHRDELQRAVNGINTERRAPLSAAQQREVLEKLIAERLLVQYGQDLGLVNSNPSVRNPLVQAVLGMLRANAEAAEINTAAARRWYANNHARFAQNTQWHVQYYRANSLAGAQAVAEQLREQGSISATQLTQLQVQHLTYVPAVLLPLPKLRDYLGDTLTKAVAQTTAPRVLEPIALQQSWAVLHVVNTQPGTVPEFETVQPQIITAMRREAGEQALQDLLQDLRGDYGVVLADE